MLNYLHPFRSTGRIPRPALKPPQVRRVVNWMMSDPARLDPGDRQRLDAILAASTDPSLLQRRILLSD
ncbi:hypothetical protein HGA13_31805 [Nocardia speluncae]|uniref:Uncharacterized protein n=1 Tax=Nocardia speluncae TaxID=419477 RepID=A0A846XQ10_9NOCA|nr:hypothetical protein [Nocardia speluncae]NKY37617.1 hypothetical protein [Nocardia speluncae]